MIRNNTNNVIIVWMFPEYSSYNATFKLSRLLEYHGFRLLYTAAPDFREHIVKQGFECEIIEGQKPTEISRWIVETSPMLVLLDARLFEVSTFFLFLEIPFLCLNTTLSSVNNPVVPPVTTGLVPGCRQKEVMRLKTRLAWYHFLVRRFFNLYVYRRCARLLKRDDADVPEIDVRKVVEEYGLQYRMGEFGYRLQVPELIMCPREFDFPEISQWTRRFYVGACVDMKRKDVSFDWRKVDEKKPLVYCSLGTYNSRYRHSMKLFNSVIAVFKRRPDWQLILQFGDVAERADFGTLPANIVLAEKVPQLEILSRTHIFITQGGFSSIREAVYFGVPMIVFPCWYDQRGNAARVEFHKLGVVGNIEKVNHRMVNDLLDRVSAGDTFRQSIKEMQQVFRKQEGCDRGVVFIKKFLEKNGHPVERTRPFSHSLS